MNSQKSASQKSGFAAVLQQEWVLLLSFVTMGLFLLFGKAWMENLGQPLWFAGILLWLFCVILASAFAIVRHAECLAVIFGEPLGTLILTLAAITIEVMMISAVMLTGKAAPTIARDTMFAVLMIMLNGMVGLSLLLGGLRHNEQSYNFYGANAFLSLVVPLGVLGLVLPNYTTSSAGPTLSPFQSVFLAVTCIGIYIIFVVSQTTRYREYFISTVATSDAGITGDGIPVSQDVAKIEAAKEVGSAHEGLEIRSTPYHTVLLILYLLPIALLAKQIAIPLDHGINVVGAPQALGGFLVAFIILSPEAMSAVRAATSNQMQRSINIQLGTALSTIGLTIPAVLAIGLVTGKVVVLGLGNVNMILLLLTFAVSTLTFTGNRTNFVQGATHLLLFFAYLALIFEG